MQAIKTSPPVTDTGCFPEVVSTARHHIGVGGGRGMAAREVPVQQLVRVPVEVPVEHVVERIVPALMGPDNRPPSRHLPKVLCASKQKK